MTEGDFMATKTAQKKPLTNAERQKRFRNNQKKYMTIEQEETATKKLWKELREILDELRDSELYAIAPLMRYMRKCRRELDAMHSEETSKILAEVCEDLAFYPSAEFNRTDKENAAYFDEDE
jgi:molecular chaperone GrpE (heat shock protein)